VVAGSGGLGGSDASAYHGPGRRRSWWTWRRSGWRSSSAAALISRERAVLKAFSFARMIRDRWQAWPARVGPLLAASFELDAGGVTVVLEGLRARASRRARQ
jgi:hypothetical protein